MITKRFEWKNYETGEVVETVFHDQPPALPGMWHRIYSFGLSSIAGGASKARSSIRSTK